MPRVIVAGGGLAGLSTAAALGCAGFDVDVFEARGFLGGRATSFPVSPSDESSEVIDNCQHILLRCCVNLLDFYRRLGVEHLVEFHRRFCFIEPGGRVSTMERGRFTAPAHFTESFLRMRCLNTTAKLAIGRALVAIRGQYGRRADLARITMMEWLREQKQPPQAIDRFWRQILVSAVNEDLDRMAACHGLQVFSLGFLSSEDSYEMGVPAVPLAELYSLNAWTRLGNVAIHRRAPVESIERDGIRVDGALHTADYYVSAVPPDRLAALSPWLAIDMSWYEPSPITGIHLWFDRPVMEMPHATLLDRTIQWAFNKGGGRYVQLVVSASRALVEMPRQQVIDLAWKELAEFFPAAAGARLERAHVIKELRATFSATPAAEAARPGPETSAPNLFLAGDWTRSGWPATMEGAVRSGYIAAEAVCAASGRPTRFLLADRT